MGMLDELFDEIEEHGEISLDSLTTHIHCGDQPVGSVLRLYLECGAQNEPSYFASWSEEGGELVGLFRKEATPIRVKTARQARYESVQWLQRWK